MTLSNFFSEFTLHDSGVDEVKYDQATGILLLRIDLSNYDQPSYQPGEPETVPGVLLFAGVTKLESNRPLANLRWGPKFNGEFLKAQLAPEETSEGSAIVEMVISLMDYVTKATDVLVLKFNAETVEWLPAIVKKDAEKKTGHAAHEQK